MKIRPWLYTLILTFFLMSIINIMNTNVKAEEDDFISWDTFENMWTQIPYENITTIWIYHPVNGSLVSDNQKLNFVVVPFDVDDLFYTVTVYKNNIHMYTCNQEIVYPMPIYTTNPINNIVTISFYLNNKEILILEYYAILLTPSFDRDFTQQWLAYRAQIRNQSMSGMQIISRRDQALSDINLVASTGMWSLLLAGVAIFFVLLFQIIKVVNLFSGMVWFGSGIIWLNSMSKIDSWMRAISYATADDVFVYYAKIITITLIIVIANMFFIITYFATSTRLRRKDFYAIDKKDRTIVKYEAVIGQDKNRIFWRLQDSMSALRRVFLKADYEITHDKGNINDNYRMLRAKIITENIDIKKDQRLLNKIAKRIAGKMAFYTKDKKTGKITPGKEEKRRYNYDAWKLLEAKGALSSSRPILILDGEPDFRREYEKKRYDNVLEEMKDMARESSDPKFIKNVKKRIKKLEKNVKKPKRFIVSINPSNKDVYSMEDWLTDCRVFDNQANLINKLKDTIHEKERALIGKAYETGEEIYTGYDKAYKDWEDGVLREEDKNDK